ncbi:MAG: hypothetical protein ACO1OB_25270 [Archangium sp.]
MNKTLIIGALTFLGLSSCVKSSSPAMADLRALDKEGSKKELVDRLGLVPPSERDDEWFDIAQRGAAEYLKNVKVEEGRGEVALGEADAILEKFPKLATSKTFMAARLDLGVRAFKNSYGSYRHAGGPNPWVARQVEFIEKDTVTKDGPSRLAKEVVLGRLIPSTAYPLFIVAFKRDEAAACADPTFTPVIVESLIDDGSPDEGLKLLSGPCASKKADLKAAFKKEGRSTEEKRRICKLIDGESDMKAACDAEKAPY